MRITTLIALEFVNFIKIFKYILVVIMDFLLRNYNAQNFNTILSVGSWSTLGLCQLDSRKKSIKTYL